MALQKETDRIEAKSWQAFILNGKLIFSPPDEKGLRTITGLEEETPLRGEIEGAYRTNDADWEAFDGDVVYPGEIRKGVCVGIFTLHDQTVHVIPVHSIQLQAD